MRLQILYIYKDDLTLDNVQWLMRNKNPTKPIQQSYLIERKQALTRLKTLSKNCAFANHIYIYKDDLTLNNVQWLMRYKNPTRSNQQSQWTQTSVDSSRNV